jgi:hypothetical protein
MGVSQRGAHAVQTPQAVLFQQSVMGMLLLLMMMIGGWFGAGGRWRHECAGRGSIRTGGVAMMALAMVTDDGSGGGGDDGGGGG